MLNRRYVPAVFAVLFILLLSCASVPKEAVELSSTVGRDIAVLHKSHKELARILFDRMKHDANRFIDEVYAPYQIKLAMERQYELSKSSDQKERNKSLLLAINAAFKPDASPGLQAAVLKGMGIMVQKLRNDIESMRSEILEPINAQEADLLASIDRSYQQLHYANSIVTGHLSSVVKVHEAQAELLNEIGIERDLRKEVGEKLSKASDKISRFVESAEKADDKLENVEEKAKTLKDFIGEISAKIDEFKEKEN